MSEQRKKPAPAPSLAARYLAATEQFLQRISERQGPLRQLVHMAHLLIVGIRRSQITRMAAALSYRTIFGLIPVLVIGMLLIAGFASKDQVRYVAVSAMKFAGLSAVIEEGTQNRLRAEQDAAVKSPDALPPPTFWLASGEAGLALASSLPEGGTVLASGAVAGVGFLDWASRLGPWSLTTVTPPSARTLEDKNPILSAWIDRRYDGIRSLPKGLVGIIGLLTLIYAAISMLVEIEKAFNQIYNAPEGRSWIRRITQYWTLLTLGALFLVMSFYVQDQITGVAKQLTANVTTHGYRRFLLHSIGFIATVGISTVLLLIVFMIVPNTRVQVMPALVGALTAAILWESGKWGFGRYVSYTNTHDTGYSRFYGTVAILPLFMLWIYLTWIIILMGLQLASALQTNRVTNAEGFHFSVLATFGLIDEERQKRRVKIVDPASVLLVLIAVAERFGLGKPSDHADVASKTGIDEQAVADMLERLAGAGMLLRVADAEHEGTYTLARPPDAISAVPVLALAPELIGSGRADGNLLLANLSRVRNEALAGKTIADLMEKAPPPQALFKARTVQA